MLQPLLVPAQLALGINLFVPSGNAIYEVTGLGSGDDPEVELKRCAYDGTLVEPTILTTFSSMQANQYLPITAYS